MPGRRAEGRGAYEMGRLLNVRRILLFGAHLGMLALLAPSAQAQGERSASFPGKWLGHWEGTLVTISPPDSVRNNIPITLDIARTADSKRYMWRTVFNRDTVRGLRDYALVVVDPARGYYATDEGNGLTLAETLIGDVLESVFQVGGRVLRSSYQLRGDTLRHQLSWWDAAAIDTMRGSGATGEGGAEVRTFRVAGVQRAVFVRKRLSK